LPEIGSATEDDDGHPELGVGTGQGPGGNLHGDVKLSVEIEDRCGRGWPALQRVPRQQKPAGELIAEALLGIYEPGCSMRTPPNHAFIEETVGELVGHQEPPTLSV
jgi:hypothetical protein